MRITRIAPPAPPTLNLIPLMTPTPTSGTAELTIESGFLVAKIGYLQPNPGGYVAQIPQSWAGQRNHSMALLSSTGLPVAGLRIGWAGDLKIVFQSQLSVDCRVQSYIGDSRVAFPT